MSDRLFHNLGWVHWTMGKLTWHLAEIDPKTIARGPLGALFGELGGVRARTGQRDTMQVYPQALATIVEGLRTMVRLTDVVEVEYLNGKTLVISGAEIETLLST